MPQVAAPTAPEQPLGTDELSRIGAWWRATNHPAVGQVYLLDNPVLREPGHSKPRNRD